MIFEFVEYTIVPANKGLKEYEDYSLESNPAYCCKELEENWSWRSFFIDGRDVMLRFQGFEGDSSDVKARFCPFCGQEFKYIIVRRVRRIQKIRSIESQETYYEDEVLP
jgi:hypothetical protein